MRKLKVLFLILLMLPLFVSALTDDEVVLNIKKGDNNSLVLAWDVNGTAIDVYRSTSKDKNYKKINTVDGNTYTDTKLAYGKTYYYKVAFVSDGYTSNVVSKKVVPNQVTNVVLNPGNKQIKVTWAKTSNNGYEVYRSTSPTSGFKRVKTISKSGTLSFTNKSLKTNTTYYYKVRSYHKVKGKKVYGAYSDVVSARTAPAAPKINSLKAANYNEIDVNIKSVGGASYYEVYRSTSKNKNFKKIGTTETLVYKDSSVLPTKTYYYKVKACNVENKCGSLSGVKNTKTSVKKVTVKGTSKSSSIELNYNKVDYATGYDIYQSTSKNKNYKKVKTVDGATTTISNLKPGTTYYFKVKTFVTIDSKKYYSGYSNIVSVKPTMKSVTNLTASASGVDVTLKYNYSNYEDAMMFQVQRSTAQKGTYTTVATINAKDSFKDNIYTFSETNLSENTTYYYKVRALVKVGTKTYYGGFSEIKSVTTGTKAPIYVPDYEGALNKANEIKSTIKNRNELENALKNAGFDENEISYALENVVIDWNALALAYVNEESANLLSRSGINNLLMGYRFNSNEIDYAFNTANIDFKEVAYNLALREYNNYNGSELESYLIGHGFTSEEAVYAVDKVSLELNPIKFVNRADETNISVGDEVRIENEHFYVASIDENKTLLLPKYNLKVGRRYSYVPTDPNPQYINEYSSSEEGYGLQSDEALGYKVLNFHEESNIYGVLYFCSTATNFYWIDGVGTTYPGAFGVSPYPYVYDNHSYLYEHVERYVNHLKSLEIPVIKGRLMDYTEAQTLATANQDWLYNTSFWLGSAGNTNSEIWTVGATNKDIVSTQVSGNNGMKFGVRPVIEISTTDMPDARHFRK